MRFLLITALLFTATNTFAQDCAFSITGHVEDSDNREKLEGATVFISQLNRSVTTDSLGDFVFTGLCEGVYTVVISHIGCLPVTRNLTLNRNRHLDVLLPHEKNLLESVTIAAPRSIVPTGIRQELSGRELEFTRGQSFAEALSRINGVTMLQTGSSIAKPVFHGLHGNRILTINNGVRQEGQQWGNEQAPEVDVFLAEKLVVVKGVDELRYGSDAIGGVILVEPKPLRFIRGISGEFNTMYYTNNGQYVLNGSLEHQLKNLPEFSYRVQGSLKRSANVATPDYRLNNTGSREKNFSLSAGWKKTSYHIEAFYSQFQTRVGIFKGSHIGNLTDLLESIGREKPASQFTGENTYRIYRPNQEVTHHLFKLRSGISSGKHRFNIQVAAQYNNRQEFDITRSNSNPNPQLDLAILTVSEDLSWDHPAFKNLNGTVGISLMQQENSYSGRYFIPNYSSRSAGAYWIEKYSKHKWQLQGGIRFDNKQIDTRRLVYNGSQINHDFSFSTLASSFNAIYSISPQIKVNASISLSSRAPHVNELLSNGIHHGTATYEEGDIMLKPEKAKNIAAGLNYSNKEGSVELNAIIYYNSIDRFIYQQPMPSDPVLTIAGAFPKFSYKQTDALLKGTDLALTIKPASILSFTSKASILRATNRNSGDWLILMPSDRFTNELSFHIPDLASSSSNSVSVELVNVSKQSRVPSDPNVKYDYKIPPGGYALLNANLSTTIAFSKFPVRVYAGVKNL